MNIVIADDSQFMRVLLKNIVHEAWPEAKIYEAATGQETIDQYKANHPDVILLDIMMPDKTGIDVLKEIGMQVPILVISAAGQEQIIEEAKALGARDFIVKPFDGQKVLETIQKILGSA